MNTLIGSFILKSSPLSFRELGIDTLSKCKNEEQELFRLAETMFDTKLPPGVTMLQPFAEESSIKKVAVQVSVDAVETPASMMFH